MRIWLVDKVVLTLYQGEIYVKFDSIDSAKNAIQGLNGFWFGRHHWDIAMPLLALLCLRLVHTCYSLLIRVSSRWKYLTSTPPQPLISTRPRVPNHLAVILVSDSELDLEVIELSLLESVEKAVSWCRMVGIEQLTVYDSQGKKQLLCLAQHIDCRHPQVFCSTVPKKFATVL
jgi:hypothetical protein